jgi:probable blue pigment (indigoidine) exporter
LTSVRDGIARSDVARLILAAMCWGLGTVISKAALADWPPVTLLAIQLGVSVVLLVGLMRWSGIPLRGDGPALLGRLGLLNPGIAYALSLLGLTTITASISVLMWTLEPLMILGLAAVVLAERITRTVLALSIGALVGIALVVYDPTAMPGATIGVWLTLAGIACCATYTVLTRRLIPRAKETGQVVLAQQLHGLVVASILVATVAVAGGSVAPAHATALGLAAAVASGALYFAGAYWLYLGALRRVSASIASSTFYLIPIVGVAGGALVLGERLGAVQWAGAAIVLVCVVGILTWPSTSASLERRPDQPTRKVVTRA